VGDVSVAARRLRLLIAYDGRPFRGWQSQASGDAVQDHLERAFAKICGSRVVVHGSGRTDAGVHALGQVGHADVPASRLTPATWLGALNANLPREIRVLKTQPAPPGFHAQHSARGKIYAYRIWNAAILPPLELGRAWLVPGALDPSAIEEGARLLTGTHDFAGFAANRGHIVPDTVRTIREIRFTRRGALMTLRFEGSGFLYKMVRLLTGTLVRCGEGEFPLSRIAEVLAGKGAVKTSFAAPAEGLYLVRVLY